MRLPPFVLDQSLMSNYVTNISMISNRNGSEYPRAFVVRKKGLVAEQELAELIKRRFARHKWLTAGVHFIDAIPRTGSGKVMRRALQSPVTSNRHGQSRL